MNAIAQRVAAEFEHPVATDAGALRVSVSVGTSTADRAVGLAALLHEADLAQYEVKRLTKGQRKTASEPPAVR
jgi:GGDEF domain-containing protein